MLEMLQISSIFGHAENVTDTKILGHAGIVTDKKNPKTLRKCCKYVKQPP